MKRLIALLLVICMAFVVLSACKSDDSSSSSGSSGNSPSGDSSSGSSSGGGAKTGGDWPKEVAYFDSGFDYSSKESYKVAYLVPQASSFLYDEFDKAFASWAKRINVDYRGMIAAGSADTEAFLSLVQTHIDQGFDGILIDGDGNTYMTILEKAQEAGVAIMFCMGKPQDYGYAYMYGDTYLVGRFMWPYIGFDNTYAGSSMMKKLISWKNETWPDVPWEKVGVACVGYSGMGILFERVQGARMAWVEQNPDFGPYLPGATDNPKNFFLADMSAAGGFDAGTAAQLITQILTVPSDIEVWLMPCAVDDNAMGAAQAADLLGLTEKSCAACFGGSNLPVQWDAGIDNAWRYAEFTAQTIYAEPIICALWAMMSGQAEPEEIWPEWRVIWDKGDVFEMTNEKHAIFQDASILKLGDDGKPIVLEEHNFGQARLPTQWLEKETYKDYLAWTDLYAYGDNTDEYHYGQYPKITDLNMFSARTSVPASYSQYPPGS